MGPSVIVYKLVTGEEIIARYEGSSPEEGCVLVSRARVLQIVPQGPGQVGVAMLPWMVSTLNTDKPVALETSAIVAVQRDPEHALIQSYLQQTSEIDITSASQVPGIIS